MSWKTILVHADDTPSTADRIELAAQIACEHGAELTGLFKAPEVDPRIYNDPTSGVENLDRVFQANREAEARTQTAFEEAVAQVGIRAQWQVVEHHFDASLANDALYADLIVSGQTAPGGTSDVAEQLLLGSGRPTLVTPHIGVRSAAIKRVLVAWSETAEANRAIHEALPMLRKASEVHVVTVAHSDRDAEKARAASHAMADHLSKHEVNAQAHFEIAEDIRISEILLSRASDLDIDVMVMGAYGHSKLRELVFGGATRGLLTQMTVPVLMSP